MTGLIAVFAGILGAAVGSFLNVVAYRVPRGESVVRPPSRCPSCGTQLRSADNVPVLSWLILRGRCRTCRAPISVRYPLIEAANAVLWIAAVLRFDELEAAAFVALATTALLALSAIDLEHRRLPNAIVLPATLGALVWVAGLAISRGDLDLLAEAALCGAAAFALFFVIAFVSGGMGFGDVKLAAFVGVVTGRFGWEVTVGAVFGAFLVGGLVSVGLLVAGRAGRKTKIPFGPSMAAGALIALFAGPTPVRNWLNI